MNRCFSFRGIWSRVASAVVLMLLCGMTAGAEPAVKGYADYATLTRQLRAIAASDIDPHNHPAGTVCTGSERPILRTIEGLFRCGYPPFDSPA